MQLFKLELHFRWLYCKHALHFLVWLINHWMPVVGNDVLELFHFINWSSLQQGIPSTSQTDVHKFNFSPLVTSNYYQYQDEQFCLQFPSEGCNQAVQCYRGLCTHWSRHGLQMLLFLLPGPLNNPVCFCCFCAIYSSREYLILFYIHPISYSHRTSVIYLS